MKLDLHDRLEAVDAAAWDDLLARRRAPSPFLGWIWQDHWARAFAGDWRCENRTVVDGAEAGREEEVWADPPRAALSPGLVLLTHLIRDAVARGKMRFDFLRGEERYTYEFGPTPEAVYGVRIR